MRQLNLHSFEGLPNPTFWHGKWLKHSDRVLRLIIGLLPQFRIPSSDYRRIMGMEIPVWIESNWELIVQRKYRQLELFELHKFQSMFTLFSTSHQYVYSKCNVSWLCVRHSIEFQPFSFIVKFRLKLLCYSVYCAKNLLHLFIKCIRKFNDVFHYSFSFSSLKPEKKQLYPRILSNKIWIRMKSGEDVHFKVFFCA